MTKTEIEAMEHKLKNAFSIAKTAFEILEHSYTKFQAVLDEAKKAQGKEKS